MRRIHLLLAVSLVIACQSSTVRINIDSSTIHHKNSDSSSFFVKDDKGNYVPKGKIDSFKWILYTVDFESNALHSQDKSMPKLHPVQCNFLFRHITTVGGDTAQYFFSFYYKDPEVPYLLDPDFFVGVGTIKNVNRYLLGAYIQMDIPTTPALSSAYFSKRDQMFKEYLKNYKGEMSDWLRAEAIKRGVLKINN